MAIDKPGQSSRDPTRGSGGDKETAATDANLDAGGGSDNEPAGSATPDPAHGGCLKLGWGCIPVLLVILIPPGLLF